MNPNLNLKSVPGSSGILVRSGLESNIKLATISLQKSQYGPEHRREAIKDIRDGVIHAVLLQKRLFCERLNESGSVPLRSRFSTVNL